MGLAFVCAGQGGQHVEMFAHLADEPAARPVLAAVSELSGLDVFALPNCSDDETLAHNRVAQLLVVGHAVAAHVALAEFGVEPVVCAGYSVGEMAAHAVAGVWTPDTVLALTATRARCMDAAGNAAGVALRMVAIIGIDHTTAIDLAHRHDCEVAIMNAANHVVIGGPLVGVERVEAEAPACGATHVRRLAVNIASHTRFLSSAAGPFAEALATSPWSQPRAAVLSGIDGRSIRTQADSVALLSRQIHEPLQWADCMQSMFEHGADVVLQLGPGRAIAKMIEEAYPDIPVRAFDEFRSAAGAARWIERHL